jgi:hypothetical protein
MSLPLPPEVGPFVDLIGEHATLLLIEIHGGTRITVGAGPDGRLARDIGREAAAALFGHYGHERINVPLAKGWRARLYRARGMSYPAIARKLGCNEATVHRHVRAGSQAQAQAQLQLQLG